MNDKCQGCKTNPMEKEDKRFKQWVCMPCFGERRRNALAASDSEWYEANGLVGTLTVAEADKLGFTQEEVLNWGKQ